MSRRAHDTSILVIIDLAIVKSCQQISKSLSLKSYRAHNPVSLLRQSASELILEDRYSIERSDSPSALVRSCQKKQARMQQPMQQQRRDLRGRLARKRKMTPSVRSYRRRRNGRCVIVSSGCREPPGPRLVPTCCCSCTVTVALLRVALLPSSTSFNYQIRQRLQAYSITGCVSIVAAGVAV